MSKLLPVIIKDTSSDFLSFQFIFIFQCVLYKPLKYGNDYKYPIWAEIVGFCLSISSMIWIPLYAIYYVFVMPGSIKEVING